MSKKQVITITPTGGLQSLHTKRGQGVDVRQFGKASIRRASLVEWCEESQAWRVDFLSPTGGARTGLSLSLLSTLGLPPRMLPKCDCDPNTGVLLFEDYEDAVEAEILTINHATLNGSKAELEQH